MPDASDPHADLVAAALRARDLDHDVGAAVARARALVAETDWHARAARGFHDAVDAWCDDLVEVRLQLADLSDEVGDAAERVRRLAPMAAGVP